MRLHARTRLQTLVIATLVAVVGAACGTTAGTSNTPSSESTSDLPQPVSSADLAHAVVQIFAYLDGETDWVWWGSGTVISPDGLILTNAHVVLADDGTEVGRLEVGVTDSLDAPPEPTFVAEAVATDWALDLAVLRIVERIDGGSLPDDLAYAALGDSDGLEIGDAIRILGYPGIGGETITLTSGLVSGFVSEAGLGNRAWVKTDATIAGGNSGGLAANAQGELVAVPTSASAGAEVDEFVDCRAVRDTNRDGSIDDEDDCVPVGGFLNGLRPVALASDMIRAVDSGVAYEPIAPAPAPVDAGAIADVYWWDPVFAEDVTEDDAPIGEAIGFPVGTTSICAFWDYEGMQTGMRWSAEWSVDGELNPDVSFIDDTWTLEEAGSFWVCADDDAGFAAGVYDVALIVEDEFMSGGFAIVGDDLSTSTVTIRNESADTICYIYVSPPAATVWGLDQLGETAVVEPGDAVTFEVVSAGYDLLGNDCDLETLFEEPLDLTGVPSVTLEWSGERLVAIGDSPAIVGANLRVGDCFDGEVGIDRRSTDIVACTSPHAYEIVGLVSVPESDPFPGSDALNQRADAGCPPAFEAYVGIPYDRSILYMTNWTPTAETWTAGDRLIVCAIHEEHNEPLIGSKKGAAE